MRGVTYKVDKTEFTRTLKVYVPLCKKTHAEICNSKALFVARGALRETKKSTKAEIKADLMAPSDRDPSAPIAALIVNAMRKAAGLIGLYGTDMKQAVAALIKNRKVASLASGWIWSIKELTPIADTRGAPPLDRKPKAVGRPKGYAVPAKDGWSPKATIVNTMAAKWDTRDGAVDVAGPALQRAFDNEEASMRQYIERKQREAADKAKIKHN